MSFQAGYMPDHCARTVVVVKTCPKKTPTEWALAGGLGRSVAGFGWFLETLGFQASFHRAEHGFAVTAFGGGAHAGFDGGLQFRALVATAARRWAVLGLRLGEAHGGQKGECEYKIFHGDDGLDSKVMPQKHGAKSVSRRCQQRI